MDGMDDSLYSDDTPKSGDKPDSVDEQEAMEPTAMIDMKVLAGKHGPPKEGDEVVLKVVKVHGDQAEVEYSETPPESIGEGESSPESGDDMEQINSKY